MENSAVQNTKYKDRKLTCLGRPEGFECNSRSLCVLVLNLSVFYKPTESQCDDENGSDVLHFLGLNQNLSSSILAHFLRAL